MTNLSEYRDSESEKERTSSLMALVPNSIETALDIGARDGFISKLLAKTIPSVTALDLEMPVIDCNGIHCVAGDITALRFPDSSFDLVFCAEVLEHISPDALQKACSELVRVSNRYVLIGVPYKQDIRFGRTTCQACGHKNPPWGHVNSFDLCRLKSLFHSCTITNVAFVGESMMNTNFLSSFLMDVAGNPYGTYSQEEVCVKCGSRISGPMERDLLRKIATRLALYLISIQTLFFKKHPNWIHILFER